MSDSAWGFVSAKEAMASIERFPHYIFHSDGAVTSFYRKKPRVLKPIKMGAYVGLQLKRHDGTIEKAYLHRLICEAFYGPCPNGMECRHLDGDKINNHYTNLTWGSHIENVRDTAKHGNSLTGELNPMARLTRRTVSKMKQYRAVTGASYAKIGKTFGVSTMTAFRAITGRTWT